MTKKSGATEAPSLNGSVEAEPTAAADVVATDVVTAAPTDREDEQLGDDVLKDVDLGDEGKTGSEVDDEAEAYDTGEDPDEESAGTDGAGVTNAPGAVVFALLAVAWLAAMLWAAQRSIVLSVGEAIAITNTAFALPGVISASLIAGASVSLTMTGLLTRWGMTSATPRFAGAVGGGLLTGLLAALAVTLSYGDGPSIMVLAGTTAAAATIGGIAGGVRNTTPVGAVAIASLAVLAVAQALNSFNEPIKKLFGSSETVESQVTALAWYSRTGWILGGLAAGLVAFGYLRWARRRAAAQGSPHPTLRWPGYLVAGAGPGLLLLAAELLTRTAGAQVLKLAGALSEADQAAQSMLSGSRVDYGLGVLFLGGFTALIAFGRTLRPNGEATDPAAADGGPADDAADRQSVVGAGQPVRD
ncbi:hypothetical protein [Micromonospora sonneratiae]|uniref:Integral membrane protein n=1 Tax=Micromonospora sonneratiae TaxID=1184706 RepID=A0ABW3YD02_9ACTN